MEEISLFIDEKDRDYLKTNIEFDNLKTEFLNWKLENLASKIKTKNALKNLKTTSL